MICPKRALILLLHSGISLCQWRICSRQRGAGPWSCGATGLNLSMYTTISRRSRSPLPLRHRPRRRRLKSKKLIRKPRSRTEELSNEGFNHNLGLGWQIGSLFFVGLSTYRLRIDEASSQHNHITPWHHKITHFSTRRQHMTTTLHRHHIASSTLAHNTMIKSNNFYITQSSSRDYHTTTMSGLHQSILHYHDWCSTIIISDLQHTTPLHDEITTSSNPSFRWYHCHIRHCTIMTGN